MDTPSFIEDHISQIPALALLMQLGYHYLTPDEALAARGGRSSNVLLEEVLKEQLQKINSIQYKGKEFPFSESNINSAILALRDLPIQDGFIKANQAFYDLMTLGKSLEQNVLDAKKSFSFRYIDWETPTNNIFHVTEEFSVLRSERNDHYRPDIVLFVNGIPMVIIECKSPQIKDPIEKAIEQHIRNQQDNGIRSLYHYSNIVIGLSLNAASYATTATGKEFWSVWKEQFRNSEEEASYVAKLSLIKNKPLNAEEIAKLTDWHQFRSPTQSHIGQFLNLNPGDLVITEQDKLLYNICRFDRMLDLIYNYILFEEGVKKITRYQQYFAIKRTMQKICYPNDLGKREGGVVWHTQGSGKSLTMVMLAQQIATHIKNPKIVLVTDRIDLDDQITETFKKCGKPVENAKTGNHLAELIASNSDAIVTTLIHKFESAVNQTKTIFDSPDIFVLVDEGHRSQYGTFNVKMQKVFPNACFIAFTGTPLLKKEKSTAGKFGGLLDVYSITDAVADKAVVPLLYEGRHNLFSVNEKPLDNFFDKVSEPLTPYGKAELKKKFSSKNVLNKADQIIYDRAWDISEHFEANFQGTGFKGQLVAPNKASAVKYKEYLNEIGKVSSELIISPPDTREGEEDVFEKLDDKVKAFWNAMMDKYGKPESYEKSIINAFKKQDHPEIIIVVDKLLTGFDAPRNAVLYITRQLKEHTLLQAIARVNRLYPGKDYGYIIDYFGNLLNLDSALNTYSGLGEFDQEDLVGSITNMDKEIEKLPQAHSVLWDLFKEVRNKYDEPAYEELLSDESKRHSFYERLSLFARLLKLALASYEFTVTTPETQIEKYKRDAKFFLALRISVKRRYSDDIDYKEYEPQVQKLIDKHISTEGEVLRITELVNVFDKAQREAEVEKLNSRAAKADYKASTTIRAINVKMPEDPVFYKRLSQLIRQTIDDYHQQRISEAEYLLRAETFEKEFFDGKRDSVPEILKGNDTGTAYFNLVNSVFEPLLKGNPNQNDIAAEIAFDADETIKSLIFNNGILLIDWQSNQDIQGKIKIALDDILYDAQSKFEINFSFESIDQLIEECLKVAKVKYC